MDTNKFLQELRAELKDSGFIPLVKDNIFDEAYVFFKDFVIENDSVEEVKDAHKTRLIVDIGVIKPNNPESEIEVVAKNIYANGQESQETNILVPASNIINSKKFGVDLWRKILSEFLKVQ